MEDKKKVGKVKQFIREHKYELISAVLGITLGTVLGIDLIIRDEKRERKTIEEAIRKACEQGMSRNNIMTRLADKVDEDIFTSLAPQIKDAVLNCGADMVRIEKDYALDGLINKSVTVTIQQFIGD